MPTDTGRAITGNDAGGVVDCAEGGEGGYPRPGLDDFAGTIAQAGGRQADLLGDGAGVVVVKDACVDEQGAVACDLAALIVQ